MPVAREFEVIIAAETPGTLYPAEAEGLVMPLGNVDLGIARPRSTSSPIVNSRWRIGSVGLAFSGN